MNGRNRSNYGTKIQQHLVLQALLLLDHSEDVGLKDDDSQVPLHTAVKNNDTNVVHILSEKPSEVNIKDKDGKTPLHYAVICGHSEAIKILLQKGGDLGIRDCNGNTPLHYAFYNCIDVAETLLDSGANLELKNSAGQTPLHIAVDGHHVAAYRQKYAMSILLDRGANVNVRDYKGQTPLHIILQCYRNYRLKDDLCTLLLNKGANVRLQDEYGRTALHVAIEQCPHCVPVILGSSSGKRAVTIPDVLGFYPIHTAVQSKDVALVKLLLDNGAKIDCKNASGKTPLHFASASAYYKEPVFQFLLQMGSNVNAEDNNKKTSLHVAAGQYINVDGHEPLCKALLDKGALPDVQDIHGMTPLHYAVRNDSREVVELLVNTGADVNRRNKNGVTPLRYVCSTPALKSLLQKGAEVNVQDWEGRTPLHHIAVASRRLPESIVSELLDWGASLTIQDHAGKTPLDDSTFTSVYMKYSIKRACANLHNDLEWKLLNLPEFQRFRDSCKEEVDRMKHEKYDKHSLFDIFRQYNDPRFLSNKELERVVKLQRLKEHFPIYDSLLKSSYVRAKERVNWCEAAISILQTPLPSEVMRFILTFIDDDSLHNVIKASALSVHKEHE